MRNLISASLLLYLSLTAALAFAQSELTAGSANVVSPAALVQVLQSPDQPKPVILNVGPSLLYMQAHIPGAEYIGAASTSQGMQALRARVKTLPHDSYIVLYCGCCPWEHCPNVRPAFSELHKLGFSNVKVLFIANNFGSDWVDKGYPVVGR